MNTSRPALGEVGRILGGGLLLAGCTSTCAPKDVSETVSMTAAQCEVLLANPSEDVCTDNYAGQIGVNAPFLANGVIYDNFTTDNPKDGHIFACAEDMIGESGYDTFIVRT